MKIWVNGRLSEEADALVSPFDHALLTGDGVFETLKIEGSAAFAVRRHLERLERSAAGLDLRAPPADQVRAALVEVIAANGLTDGVARITLTGGPAPLGS
ncbi:MAG: aminotransferase class IV, partial [Acidimicrobiia bacterium]|nr:aminotransferase class IV [Acidimicrobiia bacterium]